MFHLTPQEKLAVASLLTICLLGAVIHCALQKNVKMVHWTKTATHPYKPRVPDINTATAAQLDRVPGIGPKTAQRIIEYRNTHGPFISVEGLRRVKGINKNNFPKIKTYLLPEMGHE